jgi:hypothetical protein
MYSGVSSVSKISSGSRSRLKSKKDESRDCIKEEKITLEWFVSLVGSCSPRVAVSPCPPWPWGFSGRGGREDVK